MKKHRGRACPYCKSPAWRNPCWWRLDHPWVIRMGADAPCECVKSDTERLHRARQGTLRALALLSAIITLLILLAFCSRAHAQGTSAERAACTPDAFQLCLGHAIIGDIPGVITCLIANKQKLSKPCRDVLAAHHAI